MSPDLRLGPDISWILEFEEKKVFFVHLRSSAYMMTSLKEPFWATLFFKNCTLPLALFDSWTYGTARRVFYDLLTSAEAYFLTKSVLINFPWNASTFSARRRLKKWGQRRGALSSDCTQSTVGFPIEIGQKQCFWVIFLKEKPSKIIKKCSHFKGNWFKHFRSKNTPPLMPGDQ